MKCFTLLAVTLLLSTLCTSALQQKPKYPSPPTPMNQDNAAREPDPTLPKRIDLTQLQKEADDLARTAQTIPSDLASVRKGMLPRDVIEKLKQIEKMSKHLRSQLNH